MTIGDRDASVAALAQRNQGPFTHAQARKYVTQEQIEQRVRSGAWVRLHPRVYAHATTLLTPDVRRRAALLWAGPKARLSHRSAAEVWGLDGIQADRPEITIEGKRHPRSASVIVHRTAFFDMSDRARRGGTSLTSPTRTIIDLAAVLDEDALRVAFESARRQKLTTVRKVTTRLDAIGGKGRPGAARLNHLLALLDGQAPSEYPLEVRVAQLLDHARVDPPVRQYEVRAAGRTFRLDFAWPARRLALECDGRLRHSEDGDFQRDRNRWTALAAIGWRLLFVTWADVTSRPETVLERVNLALSA